MLIVSPLSNGPERPRKPYMTDFTNMLKFSMYLNRLCSSGGADHDAAAAIRQIPWSFRAITLDQIPFLDVAMFEMMVNSMPNLETAILTRCLLLDVTKLRPLLDVIKRHPRNNTRSKPQGHSNNVHRQGINQYIRLDFFPYFFRGPHSAKRLGSYGVTYNEPTFHAPKAVFALIIQCWKLAKEVGMDLVSDSSSFWSFVRQLPGPDPLWAMKARDALVTCEVELAKGKKNEEAIRNNLADDITAALAGDDYKPESIPIRMARYLPRDARTWLYWRRAASCSSCRASYPASLFPIRPGTCWACKMVQFVDHMEDSHLRLWQRSAIQNWSSGLNPKSATLDELLTYRKPTLDKALLDVQCADWAWEYFLNFKHDGCGEPYAPPAPETLSATTASMARWRWKHCPATEPFDYRMGGPQYEHPCKYPMHPSDFADPDFGPENMANFDSRWCWSDESDRLYTMALRAQHLGLRHLADPIDYNVLTNLTNEHIKQKLASARASPEGCCRVRDLQRRAQNKTDKDVFRHQRARLQDCLYSLSTVGKKPFNLDKPFPHPRLNPEEYQKARMEAEMEFQLYGDARNTSY